MAEGLMKLKKRYDDEAEAMMAKGETPPTWEEWVAQRRKKMNGGDEEGTPSRLGTPVSLRRPASTTMNR